jgi:alpha-methylacyl-CoA racemase
MLADAGAEVVKIERPPAGDDMRHYEPKIGADSVHFHALNRGKKSLFHDLKAPDSLSRLRPLLERADILIEQFRPGVMQRLGLDYERVRAINPRIIYCSITGYGQTGPKAAKAGHDLNFTAESGLLDSVRAINGEPALPHLLAADIAGGVYPAMINILLAYIQRTITGHGNHLDIAISEGLMPFHYDTLAAGICLDQWSGGPGLTTGASPRYNLYRTADHRYLAVAAVEDKFWAVFCEMIDLPHDLRSPDASPSRTIDAVGNIIRQRSLQGWQSLLDSEDACCSPVASLREALGDRHLLARQLTGASARKSDAGIPALQIPIARQFLSSAALLDAPTREH